MSFHDLESYVGKQKQDIEASTEQTNEYVKNVNQLYSQVKGWLAPYINSGKVTPNQVAETLSDLHAGNYHLNALELQIGKDIVFLNPKGLQAKAAIEHHGVIAMEANGGKSVHNFVLGTDGKWKYEAGNGKVNPLDETAFLQLFKSCAPLK